MLHTLPLELLARIVSTLSIKECEILKSVYIDVGKRTNLYSAIKDRKSPYIYLQQYFYNVDSLLKYMAVYNVYISGSRALEFFVPGSIDVNSDWDFFMKKEPESVYNFMKMSEANGITWLSMIQWFDLAISNASYSINISLTELIALERQARIKQYSPLAKSIIYDIYQWYNANLDIFKVDERTGGVIAEYKVDSDDNKVIRVSQNEYGTFDIVRGILKYRGKETPVQLMLTEGQPLYSVLEFHTSIVQCVIGGLVAVHMYAVDAYERRSALWTTPRNDTLMGHHRVAQSIGKYEERGYKFYMGNIGELRNPYHDDSYIKRCIGDPYSHVIFIHETKLAEESYKTRRIKELYNFRWVEDMDQLITDDYYQEEYENQICSAYLDAFIEKLCKNETDIDERAIEYIKKKIPEPRVSLNSSSGKYNCRVQRRYYLPETEEVCDKYLDSFVGDFYLEARNSGTLSDEE